MEQPETIRLSEILIAPEKPAEKPKSDKPGATSGADPNAAAASAPNVQDTAQDEAAKQADDAAALAAADAKANELLKQIRGGASFDDVAKKNSSGPLCGPGWRFGSFQARNSG